jgi:MFS family permease
MILRTHPTFRRLWLAQVVSVVGDGMQRVALLWWAKQTGGTTLLTVVAACAMVPLIVAAPVGGWLADRFDHRRLLVLADLARVATTGLLALTVWNGGSVVACTLVALTALGTAVFDPTYASAVPAVVDPADRPAANGLNIANSAVGGLAGPLVGGALIAAFDVRTVLIVNAATFAWSALVLGGTRLPRRQPAASPMDTPAEQPGLRTALGSMLADTLLRRLLMLACMLNLVVAPVPLLLVSLAVDRFGLGPQGYTALVVTLSAGMLVGSLAAPVLARRPLVLWTAVIGAGFAAAGLLPAIAAGAALVCGGVAIAAANTSLLTLFQGRVPEDMRGRVFGVLGAASEGLRPAGLFLAGPLLGVAGVTGAFVVVGAGVAAGGWRWGRGLLTRPTPASPALDPLPA